MAVVLITGCSSGFGRATAFGFAARGDQVIATMRDPHRATAPGGRAEELVGVDGITIAQLDVADPASRTAAIESALAAFGKVDVLVNNAGVSALGPAEEIPDDVMREQFEINFFGPYLLMRDLLPSMRANNTGRIVNVTSIGALTGTGFYSHYCATKHALDAISRGMDIELQQFGIRVTTVVPGGFSTSMADNLIRTEQPDTMYPRFAVTLQSYFDRLEGKTDLSPVVEAIIAAANDPEPRARYLVGSGTAEMLRDTVEEGERIHAYLRARDAVER
jgi:NAD(P)-dependent dehydrogenase (short-subunit alcohol dehydrogenase family)